MDTNITYSDFNTDFRRKSRRAYLQDANGIDCYFDFERLAFCLKGAFKNSTILRSTKQDDETLTLQQIILHEVMHALQSLKHPLFSYAANYYWKRSKLIHLSVYNSENHQKCYHGEGMESFFCRVSSSENDQKLAAAQSEFSQESDIIFRTVLEQMIEGQAVAFQLLGTQCASDTLYNSLSEAYKVSLEHFLKCSKIAEINSENLSIYSILVDAVLTGINATDHDHEKVLTSLFEYASSMEERTHDFFQNSNFGRDEFILSIDNDLSDQNFDNSTTKIILDFVESLTLQDLIRFASYSCTRMDAATQCRYFSDIKLKHTTHKQYIEMKLQNLSPILGTRYWLVALLTSDELRTQTCEQLIDILGKDDQNYAIHSRLSGAAEDFIEGFDHIYCCKHHEEVPIDVLLNCQKADSINTLSKQVCGRFLNQIFIEGEANE